MSGCWTHVFLSFCCSSFYNECIIIIRMTDQWPRWVLVTMSHDHQAGARAVYEKGAKNGIILYLRGKPAPNANRTPAGSGCSYNRMPFLNAKCTFPKHIRTDYRDCRVHLYQRPVPGQQYAALAEVSLRNRSALGLSAARGEHQVESLVHLIALSINVVSLSSYNTRQLEMVHMSSHVMGILRKQSDNGS